MKTITTFLALATALCGQTSEAVSSEPLLSLSTAVDMSAWMPNALVLSAGKGNITINLRTGQVDLPKDITLPDAAVAFWLRVAQAFPECRQAIITGDPTPKTVDWMSDPVAVRKKVELGFRSDGVVVWRAVK